MLRKKRNRASGVTVANRKNKPLVAMESTEKGLKGFLPEKLADMRGVHISDTGTIHAGEIAGMSPAQSCLAGLRFHGKGDRLTAIQRIEATIAQQIQHVHRATESELKVTHDRYQKEIGLLRLALRNAHSRHAEDLIDRSQGDRFYEHCDTIGKAEVGRRS